VVKITNHKLKKVSAEAHSLISTDFLHKIKTLMTSLSPRT
jgi:hypothetical protein